MNIFQKKFNSTLVKAKKARFYAKVVALASTIVVLLVVSVSYYCYLLYKDTLITELISSSTTMLSKTDTLIADTVSQVENLAYQQALNTLRLMNQQDKSIGEDYTVMQQLSGELINVKNSHSYIHSAYVYIENSNIIISSNMGATAYGLFPDTSWHDVYTADMQHATWLDTRVPYDEEYVEQYSTLLRFYDDTNPVFTFILPFSSYLREKSGIIVVNVCESAISQLLSDETSNYQCYLLSPDNVVLAGLEDMLGANLPEGLFADISGGVLTHSRTVLDGSEHLIVYQKSAFNNNFLVATLPLAEILSPSSTVLWKICMFAIVFLLCTILLMFCLVSYTFLPIRKMRHLLREHVKPDKEGERGDVVENIKTAIESLIEDNAELSTLIENNRMLIKHRNLTHLLQGKLVYNRDFDMRFEYIGIKLPYDGFSTVLIRFDTYPRVHKPWSDEYELFRVHLFSLIQSCLPREGVAYTVDLDDINIGIIINFDVDCAGDMEQILLRTCSDIRTALRVATDIPCSASIGIGKMVGSGEQLAMSFSTAVVAADYAITVGENQIINYSNISFAEPVVRIGAVQKREDLLASLRIGQQEVALSALNQIISELEHKGVSFELIQQYFIMTITEILNLLYESGLPQERPSSAIIGEVLALENLNAIDRWMARFICEICNQTLQRRHNKNADLLDSMIDYIQENYNNDLSLNQLAEKVYMSVPYLSKIFKDYTHQTFTEYLTSVRINRSIELLKDSNRKVMDIATAVGYANVQSFIRAFKKSVNMTPNEYRVTLIHSNLQQK